MNSAYSPNKEGLKSCATCKFKPAAINGYHPGELFALYSPCYAKAKIDTAKNLTQQGQKCSHHSPT